MLADCDPVLLVPGAQEIKGIEDGLPEYKRCQGREAYSLNMDRVACRVASFLMGKKSLCKMLRPLYSVIIYKDGLKMSLTLPLSQCYSHQNSRR